MRRVKVTIVYKSGARVTLRCKSFTVRAVRGEVAEVEWDAPRPRPLHAGVDEMIDAYKLAMLPRDAPLTIFENASGFACVICGVEAYAWSYRVKLPQRAGTACSGCAHDHGWTVR